MPLSITGESIEGDTMPEEQEEQVERLQMTIAGIRNQLLRLSQELQTCGARIAEPRPSIPSISQEERARLASQYKEARRTFLKAFIEQNKEAIQSTRHAFTEAQMEPSELVAYCTAALMNMVGMPLQGMCGKCNGQLALLVDRDELYLTCAQCGSWWVQGLHYMGGPSVP